MVGASPWLFDGSDFLSRLPSLYLRSLRFSSIVSSLRLPCRIQLWMYDPCFTQGEVY